MASVLNSTGFKDQNANATITVSHTSSAGTGNTKLLVWLHYWGTGASGYVSSITFNGDALSQVSAVALGWGSFVVWEMSTPDTGTHDVVITQGSTHWVTGGIFTLDNAGTIEQHIGASANTTGPATVTNNSTTEPVTVGALGLCMVGKYLYDGALTYTFPSDQTSLYEQEPGVAFEMWGAASSKAIDSNPETVSCTLGGISAASWDIGFLSITDNPQPPDPGGEVPPGTNPPQGTQPGANPAQGTQASSFPLLFLEVKNGSTTTAYAETMLPDRSTYWSGQKAPRILTVSPIRRALSRDGGFETSSWTVTLVDSDRTFREAARTSTLTGQYVALYVIDDATRRAEGEPYRIAAGMIASHRALPGFRYELQVEDVLGTRFADVFREPRIPSYILTSTDFPVMDPTRDGGTAPVALGELSDATATSPQGIVPAIYLGYSNLRTLSNNSAATNTLVAAFLFCQHACASIPGIYYNPPGSPSLRFLAPSTAAGSLFWAPHWPSWSQTGYTGNYADWPNSTSGYRFTPLFIPWGTDVASAAIGGTMLISANVVGTESNGDATGTPIVAPERLVQHVLTNYIFTDYRVGSYAPVPFFPANSYTILDTSTVQNAIYVAASRVPSTGYRAGALLGNGGQASSGFDVLKQFLQGSDLDMGVNRHGQIILSRESRSATAAVSYTAQADILDGSFEAWTASDEYANQLTYQFGYRYIAPSAPLPTPSVGNPLPVNPVASYNPFSSGVTKMFATSAASLVGRVVNATLDNFVMRVNSHALNVGSTVIARALGPSNDGPHMVRFSTGWQGFGKNQVDVDLGSVITVDHPEGLSSTGYTATRVRVLAQEVDPQQGRVTLTCRVIG